MHAHESFPEEPRASEFDWGRLGLKVPPWFLRLKMTWVESEIHEVERLLEDEFGVSETTDLVEEHILLLQARDALMRRLTNPAASTIDH